MAVGVQVRRKKELHVTCGLETQVSIQDLRDSRQHPRFAGRHVLVCRGNTTPIQHSPRVARRSTRQQGFVNATAHVLGHCCGG